MNCLWPEKMTSLKLTEVREREGEREGKREGERVRVRKAGGALVFMRPTGIIHIALLCVCTLQSTEGLQFV